MATQILQIAIDWSPTQGVRQMLRRILLARIASNYGAVVQPSSLVFPLEEDLSDLPF